MDIKIGDKIAYIKYNVSDWYTTSEVGYGFVFYKDGERVGCARHKTGTVMVCDVRYIELGDPKYERCFLVDGDFKDEMKSVIQEEIVKFSSQLKTLTSEEKDELKKQEFDRIKKQIISTATNLISDNENDFVSRLKSICQLKKQLFEIKISDLNNVHKHNGVIKAKIKKLKKLLDDIEKIEF